MNHSYYSSNDYFNLNKDMHVNDSIAKANIISRIIEESIKPTPNQPFKILEIGGGAGLVSYHVIKHLSSSQIFGNIPIVLHSLEPSSESISLQKKNNEFISNYFNCTLDHFSPDFKYDCILLIDVLEHIEDKRNAIYQLAVLGDYTLVNLPLENNFVDYLRNFLSRNKFYRHQRECLGHVHRFNYMSSLNQFKKQFNILHYEHWPYYEHLYQLYSSKKIYLSRIRLLELFISNLINRLFPFISPYIIQGSNFILLHSKD